MGEGRYSVVERAIGKALTGILCCNAGSFIYIKSGLLFLSSFTVKVSMLVVGIEKDARMGRPGVNGTSPTR